MRKLNDLMRAHKNDACLITGLGPSLLDIKEYKDKFKNSVIITCNEFRKATEIFDDNFRPNFWCGATKFKLIEKEGDAFFCVEDRIFIVVTAPDRYDLLIKKFGSNKKAFLWNWHNFELQKLVQEIYNTETHYGHGSSIAIHMVGLALLLGCNPIYISGVDMDYSQRYAWDKSDCIHKQHHIDSERHLIINDFKYFGQIAKNNNIDIYNLSYKTNKFEIDGIINVNIKELFEDKEARRYNETIK